MNNYEQFVPGMNMTSAMRSLSPAILGKHQVQSQMRMPQMPQAPGLGDLAGMYSKMFGDGEDFNSDYAGILNILGGI